MRMFLFSAAVSLASFSPAALASDVFVVDPAGPLTSIQDAVDAASTGDIVLVRPGVYTGDVIVDGVGLTLVGEGSCQVRGRIEVSNVPANQWALLAGLRLRPRTSMVLSSAIGAIDIKDCAGRVRVVDCNILGATGQVFASGPFAESGGPGVQATRCADVALIDVTVRGGLGMVTVTIIGGTGGAGVHLDSVNRATIMRTVTRGGDGGHGLVAGSQGVFNFQSVFLGGGFGLGVGFGGPGCCDGVPGSPFITGQPMQLLDGHPSRLEIPLVVREGQPFVRRVSAIVGERVRPFRSTSPGFRFRHAAVQPRLIGVPTLTTLGFSGTIAGSMMFGELLEPRVGDRLPPGFDDLVTWHQATLVNSSGDERRTSARPLITLRTGL